MVGDYGDVLRYASAYLSFSGYLDTEARKAMGEVKTGFDQARRVFIYEALKQQPDAAILKAAVAADLDSMEAANGPCMGEYELLRKELLPHIDKQGGHGAIMRIVTRWALPVASGVAFILYMYFQMSRV